MEDVRSRSAAPQQTPDLAVDHHRHPGVFRPRLLRIPFLGRGNRQRYPVVQRLRHDSFRRSDESSAVDFPTGTSNTGQSEFWEDTITPRHKMRGDVHVCNEPGNSFCLAPNRQGSPGLMTVQRCLDCARHDEDVGRRADVASHLHARMHVLQRNRQPTAAVRAGSMKAGKAARIESFWHSGSLPHIRWIHGVFKAATGPVISGSLANW